MTGSGSWLLVVLLSLSAASAARADEDPREMYRRAQALYALGNYAEAAPLFEKVFVLKPDSALLYNAAQSHRLAGNKPRALALYENYVRFYGNQIPNRAEVNNLIVQLRHAIEIDQKTTSAAPKGTANPVEKPPAPVEKPPTTVEKAPAPVEKPPASVASEPVAVAKSPAAPKPIYKKGWFWGVVVGAAAVVAAGVAVGVVFGSSTVDPKPTFVVDGN